VGVAPSGEYIEEHQPIYSADSRQQKPVNAVLVAAAVAAAVLALSTIVTTYYRSAVQDGVDPPRLAAW
jgi:hypothetical protein